MDATVEFSFPTRVVFGPGSVGGLGDLCADLGITRPLVITDPGLVAVGIPDRITAPLAAASLPHCVFHDIQGNPVERNVLDATQAFVDHGADGVIGLGGGSALDVAKAVRLRATHDLPLEEYDEYVEGWKKTHADVPPMIAIATTAGTGSEVGRAAVITLESTGRKTVLFGPHLMPNVAVLDAELTVGLPPTLTAWTGMDALTHSLEAYLSPNFHPFCDAVALHGLRLCFEFLPGAYENGSDTAARGMMLLASAMGATAFQKGLGATHSLAHPLSTLHGIHHGLANAVMLPTVLDYNEEAASRRLADVAHAIGAEGTAAESIATLSARVNIPGSLSELGITEADLPALAEEAILDGCHLTNPRKVTVDDMLDMYRATL
ncbi:iron-containing alcohol dehydrogenase [Candidatus Poribacteria bacterium]|jgi:4-hydroxybutyrate dehydrogenase|nr:iron-containing alcohol dehydrogenase [Candidatus Poribacteria bacterium]MBT5536672.1 iron-containing alcohol dehydrogenase [Candidatus Poribacteria bacterium]MBT5711760.1 iron-containing alcohol dehydrogenase [Candidatus Poribacteria bacterium]MBT7805623.1 iron-containing alcohol dehydrogenase [Candidatus Poribacteria bacterium]